MDLAQHHMGMIEEGISELENSIRENTPSEQQKVDWGGDGVMRVSWTWLMDCNKKSNIHVTGVPEGDERVGLKSIPGIVAENFPRLGKNLNW